jgi:hypothetical protein
MIFFERMGSPSRQRQPAAEFTSHLRTAPIRSNRTSGAGKEGLRPGNVHSADAARADREVVARPIPAETFAESGRPAYTRVGSGESNGNLGLGHGFRTDRTSPRGLGNE